MSAALPVYAAFVSVVPIYPDVMLLVGLLLACIALLAAWKRKRRSV